MIQIINYFLLCLNLVIVSLFFGGVHDQFWTLACFICLIIVTLTLFSPKPQKVPPLIMSGIFIFIGYFLIRFLIKFQISPIVPENIKTSGNRIIPYPLFQSTIGGYYEKLQFYKWLIPIMTFLFIPTIISEKKKVLNIIKFIIFLGCFQGVYGVAQYITKGEIIPFLGHISKQGKVTGTLICRNTYACFSGMIIPLILGLIGYYITHKKKKRKLTLYDLTSSPYLNQIIILFAGLICIAMGILMSSSRGGLLATIGGTWFFFFLKQRKQKSPLRHTLISILILIIPIFTYVSIIGFEVIFERFLTINNGGKIRLELYSASAQIIKNHLFFGGGGGYFQYLLELYKHAKIEEVYIYVHNDYMHLLVEYGVIGFSIIGFIVFSWLAKVGFKKYYNRKLYNINIWCGCWGALFVAFSHALIDFSLQIELIRIICAILMGILLIMSQNVKDVCEFK